jgi:UDP-glucuronate 4-epimerase
MKVLLTGGLGFVGGHTAERLLNRGDSVVIVDSVNSYYDPKQKRATQRILEKLVSDLNGQLTIHEVEVQDEPAMAAIFASEKPDVLVHLAAQAGVRYSIDNAMEQLNTNVTGTVVLLELARKHSVKHCVLASSSSIYGADSIAPFSEDQKADHPISPYAASKRACELFGHTYHHLYKIPVTMLRFFTVYGPRGRPDMAAFKFIQRVSAGQPIDKYGDGSAIREFTYVDDIVSGVVAAVDRPDGFFCVNLGGGSTHTLNELIGFVEKHVGKPAVLNQMPDQPGDVPLTSADQTVAREKLGFAPTVGLDEGIRRTVEWFKEYTA